MLPADYIRIQKYYKESLTEFGDHDARAVHWSSHEGQQMRFHILSQIADLNEQKVLDVGCGLGDLYKCFLDRKINVHYTGIDIMPEFIASARERFPDATFECKNLEDMTGSFDYVLASGALSFKVKNYKEYYFGLIKKMYDICEKGLAFNMLNHETHIDDDTYCTYKPEEVSDFCKTFCDDVQIIIDYLPQDFTLYLYKR